MHTNIKVYIHICIHTCMHICIYIYLRTKMCIYMYLHIASGPRLHLHQHTFCLWVLPFTLTPNLKPQTPKPKPQTPKAVMRRRMMTWLLYTCVRPRTDDRCFTLADFSELFFFSSHFCLRNQCFSAFANSFVMTFSMWYCIFFSKPFLM